MLLKKKDELNKAIHAINETAQPDKVFLFGSLANETPTENSDLDLCILYDELNERKIDILRKIRFSMAKYVSMPVDLLVYRSNEFNERARLSSTFEYKILNEGDLVYES